MGTLALNAEKSNAGLGRVGRYCACVKLYDWSSGEEECYHFGKQNIRSWSVASTRKKRIQRKIGLNRLDMILSGYKTEGYMDIQLQSSSHGHACQFMSVSKRWIFGHLRFWLPAIRADSTWLSSPTLQVPQLQLPGKPGDATHTHKHWIFRPISWTFFRLMLSLQLAFDCHSLPQWNCSLSYLQVNWIKVHFKNQERTW